MFLTNNYNTIDNLMICSKGVYIYKIIPTVIKQPKSCSNPKNYGGYCWVKNLQNTWNISLKDRVGNFPLDNTIKPYGNAKKGLYLKRQKDNRLILEDWDGEICF